MKFKNNLNLNIESMSETHLIKAPSNMSNLEMEMEESMYNKYD